MDVLQLLQTIGICVGALALVVIAINTIVLVSYFAPPKLDDDAADLDGLTPDEVQYILTTPVKGYEKYSKPRTRKRAKSKEPPDAGETE